MRAKRPADTLVVNGRIATMNKRQPFAPAAAPAGKHVHQRIIGDDGAWSMDCPCGSF